MMGDALYEYARDHWPEVLEKLRSLDKQLADLHHKGMIIQSQRLALFDDLSEHWRTTATRKMIWDQW